MIGSKRRIRAAPSSAALELSTEDLVSPDLQIVADKPDPLSGGLRTLARKKKSALQRIQTGAECADLFFRPAATSTRKATRSVFDDWIARYCTSRAQHTESVSARFVGGESPGTEVLRLSEAPARRCADCRHHRSAVDRARP